MDLQEVDVYIAADGEVRLEVRGISGAACLDATKGLEASLGNTVLAREMTYEAQAMPRQGVSNRQELGGPS